MPLLLPPFGEFTSSAEALRLDDWDDGSEVVAADVTPDVDG